MALEVLITLKDGTKENIDPLVAITDIENDIIIYNGYHDYIFPADTVKKIEIRKMD